MSTRTNVLPGMGDDSKHDRWRTATLEERGKALEALSAEAMRLLEADPDLAARVRAMHEACPPSPFPGRLKRTD